MALEANVESTCLTLTSTFHRRRLFTFIFWVTIAWVLCNKQHEGGHTPSCFGEDLAGYATAEFKWLPYNVVVDDP